MLPCGLEEPVSVSSVTLGASAHPMKYYPQAAVWYALNHYAFEDAIFIAERLHAEG